LAIVPFDECRMRLQTPSFLRPQLEAVTHTQAVAVDRFMAPLRGTLRPRCLLLILPATAKPRPPSERSNRERRVFLRCPGQPGGQLRWIAIVVHIFGLHWTHLKRCTRSALEQCPKPLLWRQRIRQWRQDERVRCWHGNSTGMAFAGVWKGHRRVLRRSWLSSHVSHASPIVQFCPWTPNGVSFCPLRARLFQHCTSLGRHSFCSPSVHWWTTVDNQ
jgi:hypothetical protein